MATPSTAPNRWLIAVAGTIVMICLGTVYSWSSFTQPLIASFNWSNQTTTWAFAVAIFFVGWGAVVGGRWQDKAGPRIVMLIGVLLWGLGNLLAGLGTAQLGAPWLYLTYGVIGGFGNGMAYITPLATVTKWFPDKRGLASGMVVMGFGLGAFFYGFILKAIAPFQVASKHAGAFADAKAAAVAAHTTFDPTAYALGGADISAIMGTFVATGIGIAIIGGIAAAIMRNPPDGYTVPGAIAAAASTQPSYTPTQVLRSPQFYLLWLMLFLNVTAGILIISNAVPIIRELTGAAAAVAVPAYGLVAIFNGLGRLGPHRTQLRVRADFRVAVPRVPGSRGAAQFAARAGRVRHRPALLRRRLRHDAVLQRRLLRDQVSGHQLRDDHHGLGLRRTRRPAARREGQGRHGLVLGRARAGRNHAAGGDDPTVHHQETIRSRRSFGDGQDLRSHTAVRDRSQPCDDRRRAGTGFRSRVS